MALYTIADLHLSLSESTDKPMEIFGARWTDHAKKIEQRWSALVSDEDTVVIPGDISWALKLEESAQDLHFIDSLPGQKIIGKGNHDFWWSTQNKLNVFFENEGIKTLKVLFNNAFLVENVCIAGTRGWYYESSSAPRPCDYEKIAARECGRLKLSLEAARTLKEGRDLPSVVFTHFPPVWNEFAFEELIDVMLAYGVKKCYFGHIHGIYDHPAKTEYRSIDFELISADFLNFTPRRVFL